VLCPGVARLPDGRDDILDLGFLDDVEKILAMLPDDRQTMLFSATMPDPIAVLARRFMRQPMTIRAHHDARTGPSPLTPTRKIIKGRLRLPES